MGVNAIFSVSRTFEVAPEVLFDVLVAELGVWWGPVEVFEARPGGRFQVGDDVGTVKAIEPPQKLMLELGETVAMLVLLPTPEATALQIIHSRFDSGAHRDAEAARWEERIARLVSLVGPPDSAAR